MNVEICPRVGECVRTFSSRPSFSEPAPFIEENILSSQPVEPGPSSLYVPVSAIPQVLASAAAMLPDLPDKSACVDVVSYSALQELIVMRMATPGRQRRLDENFEQQAATEARVSQKQAKHLADVAKKIAKKKMSAEEVFEALNSHERGHQPFSLLFSAFREHDLEGPDGTVSAGHDLGIEGRSVLLPGRQVVTANSKVVSVDDQAKQAHLLVESCEPSHCVLSARYAAKNTTLQVAVFSELDFLALCACITAKMVVAVRLAVDLKLTPRGLTPMGRVIGVDATRQVLDQFELCLREMRSNLT